MQLMFEILLQALVIGLFVYLRLIFIWKNGLTAKAQKIELALTLISAAAVASILSEPSIAFGGKIFLFILFFLLFLAANTISFSYQRIVMYYRYGGALLFYNGKFNALEMRTHGVSEEDIDRVLEVNGITDLTKIKAILLSKGKLIIIKR
jgi:uncharacterized membrane protein YcaP (DUF421 family)